MAVEPNTVFTNPPGRALSIRGGRLVLAKPAERRHVEAAIDQFLMSLAEDQGERAIGIILSGSSAVDGPRGVRAVRGAGGMCMAQDPQTAEFPAMPQGAIDTGLVDHVLPAGQMPGALLAYVQHVQTEAAGGDEAPAEAASDDLESILQLLRTRAKSDYRYYKKGTILRRIQRRMGLRQIASLDDYLKLLQQDPDELTQLSKDMLIGVSSFFRDPEAFEALRSEVIVPLVAAKDPDSPVRAWVPGCATGEEAYSVAMLLLEAAAAAGKSCPVQVFASDVDTHALDVARAGCLRRVASPMKFGPIGWSDSSRSRARPGRCNKPLREAVVFSRQNLLERSALLEAGPGQLPQRADLPGAGGPEEDPGDVQLRPERGRGPAAGQIRRRRRHGGPVPSRSPSSTESTAWCSPTAGGRRVPAVSGRAGAERLTASGSSQSPSAWPRPTWRRSCGTSTPASCWSIPRGRSATSTARRRSTWATPRAWPA